MSNVSVLKRLKEGQLVLYSTEIMKGDNGRIGNLGRVVRTEPRVILNPVVRLYDRGQGLESEKASEADLFYIHRTGKDFSLRFGTEESMKEYLQDQGYHSREIDDALQYFQPAATD